jgi:hypothetical protein
MSSIDMVCVREAVVRLDGLASFVAVVLLTVPVTVHQDDGVQPVGAIVVNV